jgi:hypothetical protein
MKKAFSIFKAVGAKSIGLLPFVLAFVFVTAMTTDTNAQSTVTYQTQGNPGSPASWKSLYDEPSGLFVSSDVAKERLLDAMKTLKVTLEQYAEGTGPYETALQKLNYYNLIYANLEAGKTVQTSISEALATMNNTVATALDPEDALAEKNGAINLLRP